MHKIILTLLLTLVSRTVFANCKELTEPGGFDRLVKGSSIELFFSDGGDFHINHTIGTHPDNDDFEMLEYSGEWECKNSLVSLRYASIKITAKLEFIGKNDIGMNEMVYALKFGKAKGSFLSQLTLTAFGL
jgi:hypothetical protein